MYRCFCQFLAGVSTKKGQTEYIEWLGMWSKASQVVNFESSKKTSSNIHVAFSLFRAFSASEGKKTRGKVASIKKYTKLVTSLILCLARHTKAGPLKSWGISVYRGTGHWRFCLTIAMWDRDTTTLTGSKLRSVKNQETIITTSFYFWERTLG